MLGERIGEETSRTLGVRVLSVDGGVAKLEISAQGSGKILGVDYNANATYWATPVAGGALSGEGHGVWMTKDGEVVTWKGIGSGKPTGKGQAVSWRGLFSFQTSSQKLARLNTTPLVFEYEIDENGNGKGGFWEWK